MEKKSTMEIFDTINYKRQTTSLRNALHEIKYEFDLKYKNEHDLKAEIISQVNTIGGIKVGLSNKLEKIIGIWDANKFCIELFNQRK